LGLLVKIEEDGEVKRLSGVRGSFEERKKMKRR
jgi:hypothetical protein